MARTVGPTIRPPPRWTTVYPEPDTRLEGPGLILAAFNDIAYALERWRVWFLMGNQDISLRYRRSIIGPFWISLAMAALVLGIGLLYSQIFHMPFREFLLYFACGMLPWNFISSMIVDSCSVVIDAEGHLRSVPLPAPLFSARMAYRNFLIFLHNLIVVLGLLLIINHSLPLTSFVALGGVVIYLVCGFAAGTILGPISARFRDIPQFVGTMVQLLFFLTPVMWRPGQLSPNSPAVQLNPLYHLIELVRAPLLGKLPMTRDWIVGLGLTVFLIVAAVIAQALTRKKLFLWL
jgi:ABC-type polysaccharide/polyol phosphate export permease